MTTSIPADFPFVPTSSSLSGAQLKFSMVRDRDDVFREAGASLSAREHDFAFCMKVVDWAEDFVKMKAEKPKYAEFTTEALLAKFKVNLERDFDMPSVYREWILGQVARRLHWN